MIHTQANPYYYVAREQARAQILNMKQEEIDASGCLKDYMQEKSHQNDAYKEWHRSSGAFVAKLGQQRSSMINETSKIRKYLMLK